MFAILLNQRALTFGILGQESSLTVDSDWTNSKAENQVNYQEHIETIAGKRSGKPCIKQTRISVYDVLGWLAAGMTVSEILDDYPELSADDIQACLAFAAEREHP